jgi:uncharacterized protein involved in type VI secretion and phage assembly
MNGLRGISKWSVTLALCSIVVLAAASTRPTKAQDAGTQGSRPVLGLVRAVVVDVHDPETAGRIKIIFPSAHGDVEVWAQVSLPLGGNKTGLWALPAVGEEVIVGFEHGDVARPIVLGSLWASKLPPT